MATSNRWLIGDADQTRHGLQEQGRKVTVYGRKVGLPATPLVFEPFERHAREHAERIALTYGTSNYSYEELNARANQFARLLRGRGHGRGSIIGVCLHRSPELIVTILGAMKAGAAYAPLDPTYPRERLIQMLSQLEHMEAVVASSETAPLLGAATPHVLDADNLESELSSLPTSNLSVGTQGDDHCYVICTSGSTGAPKPTAVRHAGWYNLLAWLEAEFRLSAHSSDVLLSPLGFDISQRSIMTPLFTGATLHLLPSRTFDPMLATRLISDHQVRTVHCAPSALYLLLERELASGDDFLRSLKYVFVGGEPLSAGRLHPWTTRPGRAGKLVNVYGVAECTDVSTFHVLKDFGDYAASGVPIGTAIFNTDVHILGPDLSPVGTEDGVGEICISGVSVGAGYLNDPALTSERFVVTDPTDPDGATYRTGDLGRIRADGAIMCVGRVDNQVKIRGMRLDLGDVETTLRASRRIEDATVLAIEPLGVDGAHLVAFVIPSSPLGDDAGERLDERVLRAEALAVLPAHMVPQRFILVDCFPLSPNGKVDRKALATTKI